MKGSSLFGRLVASLGWGTGASPAAEVEVAAESAGVAAELEEARQRLESQDAERRRLLADITHELATPLTSIRGYAETLQNPEIHLDPEERTSYLGNILEEARRMELLIQDLFEMARLESGSARLRPELLDWAALCRHSVARFQPKFERAGLTLSYEGPGPGGPEAWLRADGRRLEQVLENLLVNAVRYVPEGSAVVVVIEPCREDGAEGSARPPCHRLQVLADGPGFPPRDLDRIFDRFYRGELPESFPGSGLGLAIVKELVELQGGRVSAANRRPTGAQLTVTLPAVVVPVARAGGRVSPSPSHRP